MEISDKTIELARKAEENIQKNSNKLNWYVNTTR